MLAGDQQFQKAAQGSGAVDFVDQGIKLVPLQCYSEIRSGKGPSFL